MLWSILYMVIPTWLRRMFIDFADGDDCKPSLFLLLKTLCTQNAASEAKTVMGRVSKRFTVFHLHQRFVQLGICAAFGCLIPSGCRVRTQDLLGDDSKVWRIHSLEPPFKMSRWLFQSCLTWWMMMMVSAFKGLLYFQIYSHIEYFQVIWLQWRW